MGPEFPTSPSEMPLVSVVTPFYNTADHLRECIESVLAQDYPNFEYILHDNVSTDGSEAIGREYAQRDPRVRYIRSQEFRGQVPNYNKALEYLDPSSAYCKIVQADDWIYPGCLREMVTLGEANPRVGLISSYYLQGLTLCGMGLPYTETVFSGKEIASRHLLSQMFLFGSPTTVMMRGELVRQARPFYREGRLHEDTEACYEILMNWDFGFIHQVLSYLRVDPESTYSQIRHYDNSQLDSLIVLHRYGKKFLEPAVYDDEWELRRDRHYRRLARSFFMGRGREYWRFHLKGLSTEGLSVEKPRLFRALCVEFLDLVLNPKETIEDSLRYFRPR
jgi:glycosyltransferase involved in cell wall biosynthesis